MLGLLYEYIIKSYESERFRKPERKRIDTNEIWYSNGNILSIPINLNIAIEDCLTVGIYCFDSTTQNTN